MSSALTTDLYHQDAAYVAWRTGRTGPATFDLYIRHAPFGGAYVLTAGLEAALAHATGFRYTDEDLRYLAQVRAYDPAFLDFLRTLRFTGDVAAIPEGTIAFPHEPLLRVRAPFIEALLLEAGLIQTINLATLIATKAARIVTAAAGRPVAEFALRRAHAPYAVTRAAYIGGCATTSFVAAAQRFGLQPTGTIPHALVQLYDTEREAFEAVAATLPQYTLLLDTYDVRQATHTAAAVARRARQQFGHELVAVRLDSGDLVADSRYVRRVLDAAGLQSVRIVASGDLDEFTIADLLAADAPLDGFGIGTKLGSGAGSLQHQVAGGTLGAVYKLAEYADPAGSNEGQPQARRHQEQLAGVQSGLPRRPLCLRRDPAGLRNSTSQCRAAAAPGNPQRHAATGQPAAPARNRRRSGRAAPRLAGAVAAPHRRAPLPRPLQPGAPRPPRAPRPSSPSRQDGRMTDRRLHAVQGPLEEVNWEEVGGKVGEALRTEDELDQLLRG